MQRDCSEAITLAELQNAELRVADSRGTLKHRVEDRLQLARRATDDLEHLLGCGLLLQCFFCLVEQTDVFDRDRCLVGEGLQKRDMRLLERPYFHPAD